MKKNTFLFFFTFLSMGLVYGQSTATYSVVFESNWSQATHPNTGGSLPGNAHWSKLVGATHNNDITFLEMGTAVTPGVKSVAETGSNTIFFSEVNAAIAANTANTLINGSGLNTPLGQIAINNIITTEEYPLLTLVSMIAPSPDWIVTISSLSLIDTDGDWIDLFEFDVYPYDAGTDSGTGYTSANQPTNPVGVLSPSQGVAPFSDAPIGTIAITLENILGINDVLENAFIVSPNPTTGIVSVTSNTNISTIEVYTVLGALVLVQEINSNKSQLDISAISSGAYLLKIADNEGNNTIKKLIKQ